jgi:hypothetical protein
MSDLLLQNQLSATIASPLRGSSHTVARIAHRAGNDRSALLHALDTCVDWLETDIWYDFGRVAVRHDPALWRLPIILSSGRPRLLRGPLFLDDVIASSGEGRLLLDLKGHHRRLPEAMLAAVRGRDATARIAACGQDWDLLDALTGQDSAVPVLHSVGNRRQLAAHAARLSHGPLPHGISIASWLVTRDLVRQYQERGLRVFVWTVNDLRLALQLAGWGVDGIISDSLDVLAALP